MGALLDRGHTIAASLYLSGFEVSKLLCDGEPSVEDEREVKVVVGGTRTTTWRRLKSVSETNVLSCTLK